jgi:nitrile hydratase accessory protein
VSRGLRTPADVPPGTHERRDVERLIRDLPGAGEIPRTEGELSFREPWEVRTLGLVVQLHKAGHFAWPEFQCELIAVIGEWEALDPGERPPWSYYGCWQQAAERLMARKGFVSPEEFDERTEEFASGRRTPPHTHGHGLLTRDPGGGGAPEYQKTEHDHHDHGGEH